jgi:prepilin-type N-terminal cleavage/methylation domain-containing protein
MLKLRSRKAFTLLELVVALVVLGILAALAVPTYLSVITSAKSAVADSNALSVATDAVAIAAIAQSGASAGSLTTAIGEDNAAVSAGVDTPLTGVLASATLNSSGYCVGITFNGDNGAPTIATTTAGPC